MPLKPIFEKAPLKSAVMLPLRPGQALVQCDAADALLKLAQPMEQEVCLWEGAFRLSALLNTHPEKLPIANRIAGALELQREDGSLPLSLTDSLYVMRAALALYECTAQRSLAERMARWCGYLSTVWNDVIGCDAIRQHPADLMGLLEDLYRIGGKKAMLSLLEKLRREGMDWSGLLHTFAVQSPMSRVTSWADLSAGMEAEGGSEQGFYTRQALSCHGESLADGARASLLNGTFSGNGQELSACRTGWERLSRYHGAVCGALNCDEMIAGTSPSAGIDAAALGAWCEALCLAAANDEGTWAWTALNTLLRNALPHALLNGELHSLQHVNSLSEDAGEGQAYHVHTGKEGTLRILARLLRGYAAVLSHAVTAYRDGLSVNLFVDGSYTVVLPEGMLTLSVAAHKLTVHTKQPVKAAVRIRIPAFVSDVTLNGKSASVKAGAELVLNQVWQDGAVIALNWKEELHTIEGHHRGLSVMLGSQLMVMPADRSSQWAVAMVSAPELTADGVVTCKVCELQDWRRRGDLPADLPVLPAVKGDALTIALKPYAEAFGIAMFPQGHQA